jgi:antitoxin ParD1/3/4
VAHIATVGFVGNNVNMPARHTLNVSLTEKLESFVNSRIATGRYQTASEVVREGLRLLELQERDREAAHAIFKKKLKRAAAQSERGELVDGEEFITQLLEQLTKRLRKSDAA